MKRFTAIVTCAAFLTSFQLRADEGVDPSEELATEASILATQPTEPSQTAENTEPAASPAVEAPAEEEPVKYVGKAQEEKSDNKVWTKFLIAGAAVAVAIIALVCVSKDKGHHAN